MARSSSLAWRGERFRVTPWRGEGAIAHLSVDARGAHPSFEGVGRCIAEATQRGFDRLQTAALHHDDLFPFVQHGFEPVEELIVLAHDLGELPAAPAYRVRSFRLRSRTEVLEVDQRSFEEFWRLDSGGLDEAFGATPKARGRLIRDGSSVMAYSIAGLSGYEAFIQRLAVDPDHQGVGLGRALTVDALTWAKARSARVAFVNTQATNTAALGLYERLGFERRRVPLTVLGLDLDRSEASA
ncbi:MAG: GNAT family N-acetyltransferase [Microthrixaceae bacterium]|nr:GNAT family N-acetyltransferase [Microthrixaceae bacterium]